MNDERPTPDTDTMSYTHAPAPYSSELVVHIDDARRLERERDEARERIAELLRAYGEGLAQVHADNERLRAALREIATHNRSDLAGHTPAPWCDRIATGTCDHEISGRNPRRQEAVCVVPYRYGTTENRSRNARLIVAAPELLTELRAVYDIARAALAGEAP